MLPLHKNAQIKSKGLTCHTGLWYDRFFNEYDNDCKVADGAKLEWIKTVTATRIGNKTHLDAAVSRQQAIAKACDGQTLVMVSDWHFVTGMGNNHPVENGFAWHHTLGVPYLTGAAVKGMVRAWCEVWQEDFNDKKIAKWFGRAEDDLKQDLKASVGELIFFDAIPTKPVQLKADIMTPHYGDWYAKGDQASNPDGSNVPADWHDPVPLPFLVVDKNQSFQFSVGKRSGSDVDLNDVVKALKDALEWLGAGAKTATGYGRFSEDVKATLQRAKAEKEQEKIQCEADQLAQQEVKRSAMTPLQADLDRWIQSSPEPATVDNWLLEIDEKTSEEQMQIAETLRAFYELRGAWKKPGKKQKLKVQQIKSILKANE